MNHIIRQYLNSVQAPHLQHRFLMESSRSLGSLPPNINYNGLLYSFVPELQMFVNQYGHMISIAQAAAFAEISELSEFADIDDTSIDPGYSVRSIPERVALTAVAWRWPYLWISSGDNWTNSGNSTNKFAYSENFAVSTVGNSTNNTNTSPCWQLNSGSAIRITELTTIPGTGVTGPTNAPFGSTFAAIHMTGPADYYNLSQTQFNLDPGQTYTFSFYQNVVHGATNNGWAISDRSGVNQPSFPTFVNLTNVSVSDVAVGNRDANGWVRIVKSFNTSRPPANPNVVGIFFNLVGRNIDAADIAAGGRTYYIWGAQLEKGSTATTYQRTYGFVDSRGGSWGSTSGAGNCYYRYDGSVSSVLSYASTKGLTYVKPMTVFSAYSTENMQAGWTLTQPYQFAYQMLLGASAEDRAIQPFFLNGGDGLEFKNDGVTASLTTAYGIFDNPTTTPYLANKLSSNTAYYPSPWVTNGIEADKQVVNQFISALQSNGITQLGSILMDMETRPIYSFTLNTTGYTPAITALVNDPRYYQSWKGLEPFSTVMNTYGVTISSSTVFNNTSFGASTAGLPYIIWNNVMTTHKVKYLQESTVEPFLSAYPNALIGNYNNFEVDGGPTQAPSDYNGHPLWYTAKAGNFHSPYLYGELGQLAQSSFVSPTDPTSTQIGSTTGSGITLPKNGFIGLIQSIQQVRAIRRKDPNGIIIPWVANFSYAGEPGIEYYGATGNGPGGNLGPLPPFNVWANQPAGFNPQFGVTFGSPGDSLYWSENIRHIALNGVSKLLYFNAYEFYDLSKNASSYNSYMAQGLTTYDADFAIFNNLLGEINTNVGGFNIQTADSSRISWLSNYLASGAPGITGYVWRVTVKPGMTLLANGITLSKNIGVVGTWIQTPGPSLAGIGLTFI
jgi:hypothetical protein